MICMKGAPVDPYNDKAREAGRKSEVIRVVLFVVALLALIAYAFIPDLRELSFERTAGAVGRWLASYGFAATLFLFYVYGAFKNAKGGKKKKESKVTDYLGSLNSALPQGNPKGYFDTLMTAPPQVANAKSQPKPNFDEFKKTIRIFVITVIATFIAMLILSSLLS